jgi:hypothetical protein
MAGIRRMLGRYQIWETADEPADGCLVVGDPLDIRDLLVGRQDPPPK